MQTEIEREWVKFYMDDSIKNSNAKSAFNFAWRACAKKSISKEKILNFIYCNHLHGNDLIEKINNGEFDHNE